MKQIYFDPLTVGTEYERPYLAELWGYKSHHAISRGVVTPSNTRLIILFVTKEKQEALTQYQDDLEGDLLYWEGEERHGSDKRIVRSTRNDDEIHLFYRQRHHSPFVYLGNIELVDHKLQVDQPSRFTFHVPAMSYTTEEDPFTDVTRHSHEFAGLHATERHAIVLSRVGQGRFRRDVLRSWGGCAVTGITDLRLLRASHVKPWRDSNNYERLDPFNGLALIPNLDTLFDRGLMTFDTNGRTCISAQLDRTALDPLGIYASLKLRRTTSSLERYLEYHRDCVFERSQPLVSVSQVSIASEASND